MYGLRRSQRFLVANGGSWLRFVQVAILAQARGRSSGELFSDIAEPVNKSLCPWQRVVEELVRLTQPKSLDLSRAPFRDQHVGRQVHQCRIPARKEPPRACKAECEQALFSGEAVIIECVGPVRDIDVAAGETCGGLDPAGMKAEVGVAFEKRESQHVSGAVGEEVPVGPMPASERIILHVDLREEHEPRHPGSQ